MRSLTLIALAPVIGLLVVPSLSIAGEDVRSLKGLTRISVSIEDFDQDALLAGFSQSVFKTDVEVKLRMAGITVVPSGEPHPGAAYIFMVITVLEPRAGGVSPYSIDTQLNQAVYLQRDPEILDIAITWHNGSAGRGDIEFIRQAAKNQVDRFINDWLRANPKR